MNNAQNQDTFRALTMNEAYAQLQEEGRKGFSMRKLAKRMGWSTQKLYSNFKNKDEILLALAVHLRERLRKHDLAVKRDKVPLRYLLDLTLSTLLFFAREPMALEVLMEQRYRIDVVNEGSEDPYRLALEALRCPGLSEAKGLEDALSCIRLLLVGSTYCLLTASPSQKKEIFKSTEHAVCSMLRGWGL